MRALVALGDDFQVLVGQRQRSGQDIPAFSAIVALLDRARHAGDLHSDLPLSCQVEALYALVDACLRASELADAGHEDISATALRLFLEGSQPPRARHPGRALSRDGSMLGRPTTNGRPQGGAARCPTLP